MSNLVKVAVSGNTIPPYLKVPTPAAGVEIIRDYFTKFLGQHIWHQRPDFVVMTECCDRYMTDSYEELQEFYEARGDAYREYFASEAGAHNAYIAYSAILKIDGVWRNATEIYDRSGKSIGIYFKNHLYPGEYEQGRVAGTELPLFECDFGKVVCATCFDLNFEELRFRCRELRPDIIAFSSAFHGGLMQQMWAYDSRAYFAGACARFPGILSPQGEVIAQSRNALYSPVAIAELNLDRAMIHLDYNAPKLFQLKKKYGSSVKVSTPDFLGSVLLTSESKDFTVQELIAEFNLVTLDDYLANCIEKRNAHLAAL